MALSVQLGTCSDDVRKVNKSFTVGVTKSCNVIHPDDVIRPVIELAYNSNYDGYNYAYISEFHRYYYIDSIVQTSATTCNISMHCDPLKSFASGIKNIETTIYRTEGNNNFSELPDEQLPLYAGQDKIYRKFIGSELQPITYATQNPATTQAYVLFKGR